MWEFLKGKKTYLVAFAGVIVAGLHGMGYIDTNVFELLMGILGSFGLASVRHGMNV